MNIADILIYVAGILWGVELIPQLIKTYRSKNVKGISLAFFTVCTLAYILYIAGNILLKQWNIVIAHIPSIIGLSIMISLILKYKNLRKHRKKELSI